MIQLQQLTENPLVNFVTNGALTKIFSNFDIAIPTQGDFLFDIGHSLSNLTGGYAIDFFEGEDLRLHSVRGIEKIFQCNDIGRRLTVPMHKQKDGKNTLRKGSHVLSMITNSILDVVPQILPFVANNNSEDSVNKTSNLKVIKRKQIKKSFCL